jgi:hypothetical protein
VWASRVPLTATLVWTDPPAQPLAARALVNDLDLIVTPPGRGAAPVFGNTDPLARVSAPDTQNNVERAAFPASTFFSPGVPAAFRVVVRGTAVTVGAPQKYSLVLTGPGLQLSAPALCVVPSLTPSPSPRRRPAPAASVLLSPSTIAAIVVPAVTVMVLVALACGTFVRRKLKERLSQAQARAGVLGPTVAEMPDAIVGGQFELHALARRRQALGAANADPLAPAAPAAPAAAASDEMDPSTPEADENPSAVARAPQQRGLLDYY